MYENMQDYSENPRTVPYSKNVKAVTLSFVSITKQLKNKTEAFWEGLK